MSKQSPREKMREVIETLQRGPAVGYLAGRGHITENADEIDDRLRGWLESWVIPQLLDVEDALFKPTPQQLDRFLLALPDADHKAIEARAKEFSALMRHVDAKRRATMELYVATRREKGKPKR